MSRLIDADKLIEETQEHIDEWNGWEDTRGGMKIIQEVIREMPTIEAEPVRHGKWIKVDDDKPIAYDCSECDAMVTRMYNYCPKCGAKMEEGDTTVDDIRDFRTKVARKPVTKKNKERYARRLRARKELNIILDAVLEHFTHEKVVEYLKQYAIMQGRR